MARSKKAQPKTKQWIYNPQREGAAPEGDEQAESPGVTLLKEIALSFNNVTCRELSEKIQDIEDNFDHTIMGLYCESLASNMQFSQVKPHLVTAAMELYLFKNGFIKQVPVFELAIARGLTAMNPLFEKCVPKEFFERMKRTQAQVKGIQNMTLAALRVAMLDGGTKKRRGEAEVQFNNFYKIDDLSTAFNDLYSVLETWIVENDIIKDKK